MRNILLALSLVLTSCTPVEGPTGTARTSEIARRVAGTPQSCVFIEPSSNLRALDEPTLAYGFGRTIYINHLQGPCSELKPTSTLVLDSHAPQYCSGDYFRTIDAGSLIPGAACLFGDWVPYRSQ